MKRTASQIINDLETRIARLEKQASRSPFIEPLDPRINERNSYIDDMDRGFITAQENTQGSSHKFYEMIIENQSRPTQREWVLKTNFGRIGTKGRTTEKVFYDEDDAKEYMLERWKKQRSKGYVDIFDTARNSEAYGKYSPKGYDPYADFMDVISKKASYVTVYSDTSLIGDLADVNEVVVKALKAEKVRLPRGLRYEGVDEFHVDPFPSEDQFGPVYEMAVTAATDIEDGLGGGARGISHFFIQVEGGRIVGVTEKPVTARSRKASSKIAGQIRLAGSVNIRQLRRDLEDVYGVEDVELEDDVLTFLLDKFENKSVEKEVREVARDHGVRFEKGDFSDGLGMVYTKNASRRR